VSGVMLCGAVMCDVSLISSVISTTYIKVHSVIADTFF
jgi:hypothetical protein